jgi:polysaccharide export outer membrane protein
MYMRNKYLQMVTFKIVLFCFGVMSPCFLLAGSQLTLDTYRLQPEDVISISVFGEPDMTVQSVPIGLDGRVSIPLLGFVDAAGKTLMELQNYIRTELINRGFFVDPIVTVNILAFRPIRARVVGVVAQPGQYDFRPGDRILDLLARAGGKLEDGSNRANLKRATLIRKNSVEQIPINLEAMLDGQDLSQNYELQDGDVLNVPETTENRVNILGLVNVPRQIVWRKGLTLADAMALAQGEVPYRGKVSGILIQRPIPGRPDEYFRFSVDFTKYLSGKDPTQNILLMPGDLIYIPPNNNPDLNRLSQLAGIAFTISALSRANFNFFPNFGG